LIAVIAIWAIIGFRIYNAMSDDIEILPATYITDQIEKNEITSKENILDLDYTNPFTGKRPKRKSRQSLSINNSLRFIAPVPEIVKPNIVYKGYSYNDLGERRIALTLEGQLKFVKNGVRIEDISIIHAGKEELTILYKGKTFNYFR